MPTKEPNTKRDYGFNYSAELGADTITASTWTSDTGLTLTNPTFSTTQTAVWIEGGTEGQTLTATNFVTTAAGRTYRRVLTLFIRAAVDEADDYRAIAADAVQSLAPAPTPLTTDYSVRAARAERLLVNWLQSTSGGAITSEGIAGISSSYSELGVVRGIVRSTMGAYYRGSVSPVSIV